VALGISLGLALWGSSAAAEDAIGGDMVVTKGMKPWEGCGECHDLDGIAPNGHFPNLAAQKASYLRKEMDDFRKGLRGNDHGQMGTSAREAAGATLDEVKAYCRTLGAGASDDAAIDAVLDVLSRDRLIEASADEPGDLSSTPPGDASASWSAPTIEKQAEPLQRVIISAFDPSVPLVE
jgi:cytochrome c553